jgi:hypothetical protein
MDIKPRVFPLHWLSIDNTTRVKLAAIFNIKRTGTPRGMTLNGQYRAESDGYTVEDLEALTVERMQKFTGSRETDILKQLVKCVEKIEKPETIEEAKRIIQPKKP